MIVGIAAAISIGNAVGISAISATVAHRYNEPGAAWFTGYTALIGVGLGLVSVGILTDLISVTDFGGAVGRWLAVVWILPAALWAMFALRYTGRFVSLSLKTGALIAFPLLVLTLQGLLTGVSLVPTQVLGLLGITTRYYAVTLAVAGIVLVVRATRRYDHLTAWQGIAFAVAPAAMWLFWSNIPYTAQLGQAAGGAAYVLGSLGAVGGLGLAVFRFDAFKKSPAVGVVGERDVVDETDDLVLIADDEHRVVRANESARTASGDSDPSTGTVTVEDTVGTSVDGLRATETLELNVEGTSAKFDPQVSTVLDQHDQQLGTVISLREVTERELRKERLAVLNRVLRHNLRNQIDVVNAHLEAIDNDHADAATEATDRITHMSNRARTIDRLLSETHENVAVDVAELLRGTVAAYDSLVAVEAPDSLMISTDGAALEAAIESAVDNAVTHATNVTTSLRQTPDGCEIQVTDDGPGIPESELSALETSTETALQHGTGLGLWQLTWAVRTLDGTVSFDTSNGTTVTITVFDASSSGESETTI
ncbi:ATP-binding protein [Halorubrum ezzemoulense]|uniref:sensor histidine kinase n=1 Tax=Halorubrum ezzemoulense TaxID=337243 RepID=UPI00232DEAF3|nr:sensor histidine kinase [Halorubrum ezzemoulense]MDB9281296.1 ATP-binding protein [Halorubrum ezzemoulense]MDB9284707.1 ATP-binding protein [Halorubrum ezzemoulense]